MSKYKCECGKEYEKVGSFNLHKYHCNLKKGIAPAEKSKAERVTTAPAVCEHDWFMLSNNTTYERLAKQKGFIKYCGKCEELE